MLRLEVRHKGRVMGTAVFTFEWFQHSCRGHSILRRRLAIVYIACESLLTAR